MYEKIEYVKICAYLKIKYAYFDNLYSPSTGRPRASKKRKKNLTTC